MKKFILIIAIGLISVAIANDGAKLYQKCAGCHGVKAEKKALNKSEIIAKWDTKKIEDALKGYKDGTYGGAMKGLMKSQVSSYDDKQIKAVSEYISSLK